MPKALVTYVRCIDSVNVWLGKILPYFVLVLIGILLIEGISRYIFHTPTDWSIELSLFVIGTAFLLGGAYVLSRREHVRMDTFYNRWSVRRRAIADLATSVFAITYLTVFIFGGILDVGFALRFSQCTWSLWGPPTAPIKIIVTIGATLLLLQVVALCIRDLSIVRGKPIK